jgi:hypothetical protein
MRKRCAHSCSGTHENPNLCCVSSGPARRLRRRLNTDGGDVDSGATSDVVADADAGATQDVVADADAGMEDVDTEPDVPSTLSYTTYLPGDEVSGASLEGWHGHHVNRSLFRRAELGCPLIGDTVGLFLVSSCTVPAGTTLFVGTVDLLNIATACPEAVRPDEQAQECADFTDEEFLLTDFADEPMEAPAVYSVNGVPIEGDTSMVHLLVTDNLIFCRAPRSSPWARVCRRLMWIA